MAEAFATRHADQIKGTLTCFDRLVFFGSFREIQYHGAMEGHLWKEKIQLIDYEKKYANELRLEMVNHVKYLAYKHSIDIQFVNQNVRKEDLVAERLAKRGKRKGLVCILSAMESCRCCKVRKSEKNGFLCLKSCPGKCLHYYIYFVDEELGSVDKLILHPIR